MTSKVIHAIDHGSVQHSFLFAYTTYVSLSCTDSEMLELVCDLKY